MSDTKKITIAGAGAFIKTAGNDRPRPYGRGDQVEVDGVLGERLIQDGVAVAGHVEVPAFVENETPAAPAAGVDESSDDEVADAIARLASGAEARDTLGRVREQLELDDDADEDTVLAAIDALKQPAPPADTPPAKKPAAKKPAAKPAAS